MGFSSEDHFRNAIRKQINRLGSRVTVEEEFRYWFPAGAAYKSKGKERYTEKARHIRADFHVKTQSPTGKVFALWIELKNECGTHEIATAIGQLTLAREFVGLVSRATRENVHTVFCFAAPKSTLQDCDIESGIMEAMNFSVIHEGNAYDFINSAFDLMVKEDIRKTALVRAACEKAFSL